MLQSFANGRIFGEIIGVGQPSVLALHGWGRSRLDFSTTLAGLDIGSIALDLPGFGSSPPPGQPCGSKVYAEQIRSVLLEMTDQVVIVGHSLGGRVAVHLCAAEPQRVKGLVLTGAPLLRLQGLPKKPSLSYRLVRLAYRRGLIGEAQMEKVRQARGSADYRAAVGVMRSVLVTVVNESYETELAAIDCPVELAWGADDAVVPAEVAKAIEERLVDARLTILEGVGHFVPNEAPEALRQAIVRLSR